MKNLSRWVIIGTLLAGSHASAATEIPGPAQGNPLVIVPAQVPAKCARRVNHPQVLFDVCRDQLKLLEEAKALARASGKSVLVSFGADWCIWCHVFEAHILGQYGSFTYTTPEGTWTMQEKDTAKGNEAQAAAFKTFVASKFVVVNIAQEAGSSAEAVLKATGVDKQYSGSLPLIYVLDQNGRATGTLESPGVEVRRDTDDWYRGYDRAKLLNVLQSLVTPRSSK